MTHAGLIITIPILILACGVSRATPRVQRLPTPTDPTMATIIATEALATATVAIEAPASRAGEAKRDLGFRPDNLGGSSGQAAELLRLIEEQPDKADYQIIYNTEIDTVLFACNFEKQIVFRLHQTADGHGTQEVWEGYVLERLQAAAFGSGSLNDTPEGKIPVIKEDY